MIYSYIIAIVIVNRLATLRGAQNHLFGKHMFEIKNIPAKKLINTSLSNRLKIFIKLMRKPK